MHSTKLSTKIFPLNDNIGYVELINHMGNELDIVNDARVSYDKEKKELDEKDIKLIKYLIQHKHTSPFRGVVFKFQVKAPLFLCRQWFKHVIGSSYVDEQNQWNEVSLRYVEFKGDEFYVPFGVREQSPTNKQASMGQLDYYLELKAKEVIENQYAQAYDRYEYLIELGVCKEQARMVLPSGLYTRFRWTVSLQALLHFLSLRDKESAQWEIQQYAIALKELVTPILPNVVNLL